MERDKKEEGNANNKLTSTQDPNPAPKYWHPLKKRISSKETYTRTITAVLPVLPRLDTALKALPSPRYVSAGSRV